MNQTFHFSLLEVQVGAAIGTLPGLSQTFSEIINLLKIQFMFARQFCSQRDREKQQLAGVTVRETWKER